MAVGKCDRRPSAVFGAWPRGVTEGAARVRVPHGMTRDEFNAFCARLPAATHVVQWGGSDVWKVGGKVFAVCGWSDDDIPAFTFKVGDVAWEVLSDAPGIRPAPYLASRGMKWVQVHAPEAMSDESLREHIEASWEMAVARLTKKARAELGV